MGGKQKAATAQSGGAAGGRWVESSPSSAGWEIAMKGKDSKLGEREKPRLSWNVPIRRAGLNKHGHLHRSRKGGRN